MQGAPTDVEDLQRDVTFEAGKFGDPVGVEAQLLQPHVAGQFRHLFELVVRSVFMGTMKC